jgi:hypothetical protein
MLDFKLLTVILLIVLAVLLAIDWRQTLVIAQPGRWTEQNPVARWFIDRYGRNGVHLCIALAYLAHALCVYLLIGWRADAAALWAGGWACVELWATVHNYRAGIRF